MNVRNEIKAQIIRAGMMERQRFQFVRKITAGKHPI